MPEKHLHIISFDIPYPPNYGGVIDVFYKIKALHSAGIKIHLHCIEYPGRDRTTELNKYCFSVDYYRRKTGILSALSQKPYIVSSRRSKNLMETLVKDDYPILFEGLHSCYYLNDKRLRKRFKIYRESNIEHRYYINLCKAERNLLNKTYYLTESIKLKAYQNTLRHADLMLAVSKSDTEYLKSKFPKNHIEYLPSFHANNDFNIEAGKGDYVLYHGNIEVPENALAAEFLLKNVFNDLSIPLIIAGMNPPEKIIRLAEQFNKTSIIANPDDQEMFSLIQNAQINILITFQATGLKLKLLNTLYNGRHCLVNDKMLNGTSLDSLCLVGNDAEALKSKIKAVFDTEFDINEINQRKEILNRQYCNKTNAEKLIGLIP